MTLIAVPPSAKLDDQLVCSEGIKPAVLISAVTIPNAICIVVVAIVAVYCYKKKAAGKRTLVTITVIYFMHCISI